MRIAVISTNVFALPIQGYGGLEMVSYLQAEGLVKRGHQVILMAPHGTKTSAELHPTTIGENESLSCQYYKEKLRDVDVILDHSWTKPSYLCGLKAPILGWMHAPASTMYSTPPPVEKPCLVSISDDQGADIKGWLDRDSRTCYNGVDLEFYKNDGSPRSGRFLFLARMSKLKGPHIAVSAAKAAGVGLDLVGDDTLVESKEYVEKIKSLCDGEQIKYHGPASRLATVGWFSRAKALVHPNHSFREPFGLTLIEAQACGTPVIAFNFGSTKELVDEEWLYNTFEELVEQIKSTSDAPLTDIFRYNAHQFSITKHLDRVEELCGEAITNPW